MCNTKDELTEWALNQFTKYGIKQPDDYSEQELLDLNPAVPAEFTKQHVKMRDSK